MSVPVVIFQANSVYISSFFVTVYANRYDTSVFLVNFMSLLPVVIAKFPFMHRKRIFGINK